MAYGNGAADIEVADINPKIFNYSIFCIPLRGAFSRAEQALSIRNFEFRSEFLNPAAVLV
jgi:hypothetical protein